MRVDPLGQWKTQKLLKERDKELQSPMSPDPNLNEHTWDVPKKVLKLSYGRSPWHMWLDLLYNCRVYQATYDEHVGLNFYIIDPFIYSA